MPQYLERLSQDEQKVLDEIIAKHPESAMVLFGMAQAFGNTAALYHLGKNHHQHLENGEYHYRLSLLLERAEEEEWPAEKFRDEAALLVEESRKATLEKMQGIFQVEGNSTVH